MQAETCNNLLQEALILFRGNFFAHATTRPVFVLKAVLKL